MSEIIGTVAIAIGLLAFSFLFIWGFMYVCVTL